MEFPLLAPQTLSESRAHPTHRAHPARYVVQDESGERMALRPENVQQVVKGVVITNIEGDPSLNGQKGSLIYYNADKDRCNVRLARRTVSVRPENVLLPNGTCVTIRQVVARPQINGLRGTIQEFDKDSGRYTVQLLKESLKLKPANVLA